MFGISEGYEQLWKAIIRPPRAIYKEEDLGPKQFKYQGLQIQRTDIQIINKRGLKLKCSHYQPIIRPCKQLPCVIYLHGNSSCRLQGRSCIPYILCHDITLFTFDFAGCGNSQGQYISLGYYESEDVDCIFKYLRSLSSVSSIGIWGRSMGAVTALMYADKNHQIACIVCDSAFSNLQKLCKQLAQKYGGGIVSVFSGVALSFIAKTIKQKNGFDIQKIDPLGNHVKKAFIPAFFIAAKDDIFILPKHTQKLYEAYSGQKKKEVVEGDHNSQRQEHVNEAISIFFYNNLHVEDLIIVDKQYIQQQKKERQSKKQQKQKKQNKQGKQKREVVNNIFQDEMSKQEYQLQLAIKLSLQQSQKQNKKQQKQKIPKQLQKEEVKQAQKQKFSQGKSQNKKYQEQKPKDQQDLLSFQ